MADLEYTITLKTDAAGAKALQQGVAGLNAEVQKSKQPFEESTHAHHQMSEAQRDLIQQAKVLRHEIPGLGEVIHVLRHPVVAAAVAIGVVIEAFKKWDEKIVESVNNAEKISDIIKPFNDFKTVAIQSAMESDKFAAQLSKIGTTASVAADNLKHLTEQAALINKLKDEEAGFEEKLAISIVKRQVAEGKISGPEGEVREAQIRLNFSRAAEAERIRRSKEGVAGKAGEVAGLFGELGVAGNAAAAAKAAADEFALQQARSTATGKQGEAVQALTKSESQKRIEQINKELGPGGTIARAIKLALRPFTGQRLETLEENTAKLEAEKSGLESTLKSIEDSERARAEFQASQKRNAEAIASNLKTSQEHYAELLKLYTEAKKNLDEMTEASNREVESVRRQAGLGAATAGEDLGASLTEAGKKADEKLQSLAGKSTRGMTPAQLAAHSAAMQRASDEAASASAGGALSLSPIGPRGVSGTTSRVPAEAIHAVGEDIGKIILDTFKSIRAQINQNLP